MTLFVLYACRCGMVSFWSSIGAEPCQGCGLCLKRVEPFGTIEFKRRVEPHIDSILILGKDGRLLRTDCSRCCMAGIWTRNTDEAFLATLGDPDEPEKVLSELLEAYGDKAVVVECPEDV